MADMTLQAEKQLAAALDRCAELRKNVEEAQKQLDDAEHEAAAWEDFLSKYKMLANGHTKEPAPSGSIEVKRNSLPGQVAGLLQAHGQMTLTEIVQALNSKGIGAGKEGFRTILNTALWRRTKEDDLFAKNDKGYKLRTAKFKLTD